MAQTPLQPSQGTQQGFSPHRPGEQAARRALIERLGERSAELERAILTRIHAISDSLEVVDPGYDEGLRRAVSAGIEYGLSGIERGTWRRHPIPVAVISQARLAARVGVKLDTVLRRYVAGYSLLGDQLIEEADGLIEGAALKWTLQTQVALFDRLLTTVADEYASELALGRTSGRRRTELVQKLLAGELLDPSDLAYDLTGSHTALVAVGKGAAEVIREVALRLDRRLLLVESATGAVWAWLGGRRSLESFELSGEFESYRSDRVALALGEPGEDVDGWRLTHNQAKAALFIALRSPAPVRYADVALLAGVVQNELLARSLRRIYLEPLARQRDGGHRLRQTLRAYLGSGGNVSSAAARLGVKRHTVTNRLRMIEELIGRSVEGNSAEIDVALRLDELSGRSKA